MRQFSDYPLLLIVPAVLDRFRTLFHPGQVLFRNQASQPDTLNERRSLITESNRQQLNLER